MCGIAGFVGKGDRDDLERMTKCLEHRGPDDEGFWHDEYRGVYLGHKRLSIIDLPDGSQPMWTIDESLCVIYNGEIYNHLELRKKLENKGHKFCTDHSDTEVLLHGYKEWGTDLPTRVNGMWAFAIYDRHKNLIFISRDRFGQKPLFYTLQNKTFAFASELSAFTCHPFISTSLSKRSLKKYFAYGYMPAPNSLYSGIYKLPAGHNIVFDCNNLSLKVSKYWDFVIEPFDSIPENPEEEWGEILCELLMKAVKRRLMSDVPIGVFLSGGIDSSIVTAFASQALGNERLSTFSIGFNEDSFDESKYAKVIADLFNTRHYNETLKMEGALDILPDIIRQLDEPMGDGSLIPTYLLCRETRKHVTVALGGDGGDELFAGYDPFRALNLAELYSSLMPKPIHQGIRMAINYLPVSHKNISLDFKLKRTLKGLSYPKSLWNPIWLSPLEPHELEELFLEPTDIEDLYSEALEQWDACSQDNIIDKTLQFYTKLFLQEYVLVKTDRASMMNSLEVRAPFLDIDLVDFVRRIPSSWKYRKGCTKYLLKKASERILPNEIIYRAKHGFGMPISKWFQLGLLNQNFSKPILLLSESFCQKRLQEHLKKKNDHRLFLWSQWLLEKFVMKHDLLAHE